MDDQSLTVKPLFDQAENALCVAVERTESLVKPLFDSTEPYTPPVQKTKDPKPLFDASDSADVHQATSDIPLCPLFQSDDNVETMQPVRATPEKSIDRLFHESESPLPTTAPQIAATHGVQPAFDEPKDPLVEKVLSMVLKEYPDQSQNERVLRNMMTGLFPVDFDRIACFAQESVSQQQAVTSETQRNLSLHSTLQVQESLAKIIQDVKNTQNTNHGSLLQKLKKEVSSLTSRSDPAQWYDALRRMKGSLNLVAAEIPPIIESGQPSLQKLTRYTMILKVIEPTIQDQSLGDAARRRLNLLLGAVQQLQNTLKQLDQTQAVIRGEIQQIDETITITLPALGFTG